MAQLISPSVIEMMVTNEKFKKEFPFLKHPAKKAKAGCRGCQGQPQYEYDWHSIKRSIAGLADTRKRKLKEMLGASQIKLIYRDTRNRMRTLFF